MAKSNMVSARLSESEEKMLYRLMKRLDKGKSVIIRMGIKTLYRAYRDGELEVKPKKKVTKKKKRSRARS